MHSWQEAENNYFHTLIVFLSLGYSRKRKRIGIQVTREVTGSNTIKRPKYDGIPDSSKDQLINAGIRSKESLKKLIPKR